MMHTNDDFVPAEDLFLPWCNSDAVTSSLMEAISFVTPLLEGFIVSSVAEGLRTGHAQPASEARYRAFMREEASHSWVHRQFNTSLLRYLGLPPPGLKLVRSLFGVARRHLSPGKRLQLSAALEHFAAVLSKGYLDCEKGWTFNATSTRALFAQHAHEELAHRSVVFDMWLDVGISGRVSRTVTMLGILVGSLAYALVAVPWITHRKTGFRPGSTLLMLGRFLISLRINSRVFTQLRELFLFAHRGYHPDQLVGEAAAGAIN